MTSRELAEKVFSICMTEFSTDLIHKKEMCGVVKGKIESLLAGAIEEAVKVHNDNHHALYCVLIFWGCRRWLPRRCERAHRRDPGDDAV